MTQRLFAAIRVVGLLCVLQACAALFLVQRARANTEQTLDRVGSWLAELQGVVSNEPTPLWLNGLRVWLASGHSTKSPESILDEFENYCNGKTGMSFPQDALTRTAAENPAAGTPNRYGVFRIENAERGIVACLDGRSEPADVVTFAERARRFLNTGDLVAFGELRYFLVLPGDHGGSSFLTAWTRGSAKLLEMFPERGDAPGEDLPGTPRPAEAQRQLSAGVPGKGRLTSYGVPRAPAVALERYQEQLLQAGWNVRKADAPDSLLALLGTRAVLVTVCAGKQSDHSQITLAEL
jgi:hypothetical protein